MVRKLTLSLIFAASAFIPSLAFGWEDALKNNLKQLTDLKLKFPSDAGECAGKELDEGSWEGLMKTIIKRESGGNPKDKTWEPKLKPPRYSIGLFQLSVGDTCGNGDPKTIKSEADALDPEINIKCTILIIQRLTKEKSLDQLGDQDDHKKGLSAYWAVMRRPETRKEILDNACKKAGASIKYKKPDGQYESKGWRSDPKSPIYQYYTKHPQERGPLEEGYNEALIKKRTEYGAVELPPPIPKPPKPPRRAPRAAIPKNSGGNR